MPTTEEFQGRRSKYDQEEPSQTNLEESRSQVQHDLCQLRLGGSKVVWCEHKAAKLPNFVVQWYPSGPR